MIFEMEQILYAQEGLSLSTSSQQAITDLKANLDNSNQIDFFENPTRGLFSLLNESMKPSAAAGRGAGDDEDQKFLQLLVRRNENSSCFSLPYGTSSTGTETGYHKTNLFIIQHYTISVKYSVDHIIERNKGIREINFTTLSRKNPKRFYTTDNSQSQLPSSQSSHSLSTSLSTHAPPITSLSSSNLSTLVEKSSMSLSSDTMKVAEVQTSIRNKSKTICSVYYFEVCDLIVKLQGTKSHFILCLKPNNLKAPVSYDLALMRQQIQSYSILETSLVTSNFISRQLSFPIFFYKYRVLLYPIGFCSLTKPIFEFLQTTAATAGGTGAGSYRNTIISFIDLVPITHLILAQLYPPDDLPVIDLQDYSTSLKVGQENSIFLLSNIFEILERLYYLTTDLIARKLQRIWKIRKSQKLQNEKSNSGTQAAVLRSLHYFNYFRSQRARDVVVSSILIQRKYRQYSLRKRYLSVVRPPPSQQQLEEEIIKCQSLIRGWLCRQRLKKPKAASLRVSNLFDHLLSLTISSEKSETCPHASSTTKSRRRCHSRRFLPSC